VRFFFLAHNIAHENDWLALGAEWPKEKQRLVTSGENPTGLIPVVYDGDKILTEHHAIVRYYGKLHGAYGKDNWQDFVQDSIAETTKEWRADWAGAVLGSDEAKAKYNAGLNARYVTLEALLKKHGGFQGPFSVGDATVFGQVYDDRGIGQKIDLAKFPLIEKVVQRALKHDGIKKWCDDHGKPF